jgi:bifunctional non-homologous end joining protein LigD
MTAFPEWLEPMAATLTKERFANGDWVFERKLDGIRLLAFKHGTDVRLLTRNRLSHNHHYPDVVAAIAKLPVSDAILDGEAMGVWREHDEVGLHVFDVLWLDGVDLTSLTLDERRTRLEAIPLKPPLYLVERLNDAEPWERACDEGWEGVIAKRRDAPYEHRRSPMWLKMKCEASQELVVGGFTEPKGSRVGLGALLVGYYDGDDFVFAGRVGTGFDTKLLTELRQRFEPLIVPKPPFTVATDLPREGLWVKPEVVVQVAFMEWTSHGKMRHPRLLGLRPDKTARKVVRESP